MKITVFLKYDTTDENIDPTKTFSDYRASRVSVKDGFLSIVEESGDRTVHIALNEIAMWTEEPK